MRIAICQQNPAVGDFVGNRDKIYSAYDKAVVAGADIAVFGEGIISGYYAYDMIQKPAFIANCERVLSELQGYTAGKDTAMIVGCPTLADASLYTDMDNRIAHMSAVVLCNGKRIHTHHKMQLANDGVCVDSREVYGSRLDTTACAPFVFKGAKIGITICNDVWTDAVCDSLHKNGADVILTINASPFYYGKQSLRYKQIANRIRRIKIPMVYVNDTGGYDGVLSDGNSFVMDAHGTVVTQCPTFITGVFMTDFDADFIPRSDTHHMALDFYPCLWRACTFGLQQYVQKNGFKGVVLGLSGGIDSALVASIAVDALGAKNVHTFMMPSPYTSQHSLDDAKQCADLLGVSYDIINIAPMMRAFDGALSPLMADTTPDTTEENIQARIRGNIIMALSNKFGWLALSTGNKSENAVGYATLYGDMCGGFNPIKDIYKTDVFQLCTWRNTQGTVIPHRIITKPPSAELCPNQKDQDCLPPYDILDGILKCFIEDDLNVAQTIQQGYDSVIVKRIWRLLHLAEYKRKQSASGVKVTKRDLTYDRLYPITNAYAQQDTDI